MSRVKIYSNVDINFEIKLQGEHLFQLGPLLDIGYRKGFNAKQALLALIEKWKKN